MHVPSLKSVSESVELTTRLCLVLVSIMAEEEEELELKDVELLLSLDSSLLGGSCGTYLRVSSLAAMAANVSDPRLASFWIFWYNFAPSLGRLFRVHR